MTDFLLNVFRSRHISGFTRIRKFESGIACLAMISGWYGYQIDMPSMRRRFPSFLKGVTPIDLAKLAPSLHLGSRSIRCKLDDVGAIKMPCILLWDEKRYVVLEKIKSKKFIISDPYFGRRILSKSVASTHFGGTAIELIPTAPFSKGKERVSLKLSQLLGWSKELSSVALQAIILSLFLQLMALLMPYYMQLVIDNVIASGDEGLLVVLAVAFGFLTVFNAVATLMRGLSFQLLGYAISSDLSVRLLRQLLRLPMAFFENRDLGDVFQKFRGVDYIRQFVGGGSIGVFVDGAFALLTCVFMFIYNVEFALIVLFITAIYISLRVLINPLNTQYFAETCETDSKEGSHFLETIRGLQTLKLAMMTSQREAGWRALFSNKLNANIRLGKVSIAFAALTSLLGSAGDVLIIYLAARFVLSGEMTIGIVTAFLAYKAQFTGRVFLVSDQYSQLKMLDAQVGRVADIALSEPENIRDAVRGNFEGFSGHICLQNVTFGYPNCARTILSDVSANIGPGEFVAIMGPSGTGKTTFLKLILGLIQPTGGEIFVDGQGMSNTGPDFLRKHCGAVTQESIVFNGTIADNVSLFDEDVDLQRVAESARIARIKSDIEAMPGQYNALLGEGGAVLSSGQKQRLFIARALYRSPKVLIMDEGTANIDWATEREIIESIRALRMTCIMATHSLRVASVADRVFELHEGLFTQAPSAVVQSSMPQRIGP